MGKHLLILLALMTTPVFADNSGGADSLLDTLGPQAGETKDGARAGQGIQLKDPFTIQFFSLWQNETKLSYEVNAWVQKVLKGQYADAAHLWTVIQNEIPGSFQTPAKAAHLYLLWNLGIPQTFFDEYTKELANPGFGETRAGMALDQTIAPAFDQWLYKNMPVVSPEQREVIRKAPLTRGPQFLTLQAYVLSRRGEEAAETLEKLPPGHKMKVALAKTVMLAKARKGDLRGAAGVMKRHLEPGIEATRDALGLSSHYLQVARLLYQAGALDGAEQFYERIPNKSPDYLKAREELLWVRLRQGDLTKLRGELASFNTGLFEDKFAPDTYVVRAISNLKLCYYDKVQEALTQFVESNRTWAKTIDAAMKSDNPPAPEPKDDFAIAAEESIKLRDREIARLNQLGQESIAASLPAVGPQKHWETAQNRLKGTREMAIKTQAQEYRRQWKNRMAVLKEAINKMRFVKVEFMSQVRALSQQETTSPELLVKATAKEESGMHTTEQAVAKLKTDEGEIAFPFDGVVWPDEIFHIRSVAQAQCLKSIKGLNR
jgi:tetratricopeptide (TPR) repeat protein